MSDRVIIIKKSDIIDSYFVPCPQTLYSCPECGGRIAVDDKYPNYCCTCGMELKFERSMYD